MKRSILILLGIIGLGLTLIPSILVFAGSISLELHRILMLIGTLIWFASAPFWIGKKEQSEAP